MADYDSNTQLQLPAESLITLTHVVYALHAFSAITGLTTAAFIVTAFLTGWPSIIAVIINYVKRSDVRGTFLDSHFSWQNAPSGGRCCGFCWADYSSLR